MSTIEKSIEVNVPVRTAYDQWTQFEEFPQFMEGIVKVTQLDNTHLHWKANIAGRNKEWNAVVTEQHPDERIAWKSTDGARSWTQQGAGQTDRFLNAVVVDPQLLDGNP